MSFDLLIQQGDLSISSSGDLAQVTDTQKLIQDILKICITPVGANQFFPFYGSSVSRGLLGNAFPAGLTSSMAQNQLQGALKNLMTLQTAQQKDRQAQSAAELIAAVKNITVQQNQSDLRFFSILIQVLSKDLTIVDASFEVSL